MWRVRGTTEAYPWGDDLDAREQCDWANGADQMVMFQAPSVTDRTVADCSDGHTYTSTVGRFRSTVFGVHDMHGNAFEWVQDVWHENYTDAPTDGSAWVTGGDQTLRVLRGGSWFGSPHQLRSAYRIGIPPESRAYFTGFRVARTF